MKRLSILLIALLLLVACAGPKEGLEEVVGNDQQKAVEDNKSSKQGKTDGAVEDNDNNGEEDKGFEFEANGVVIAMNAEMAPIIEKLGDPMEYFEADSCAFEGKERMYYYSGFEIHTYEKEEIDHVQSVVFNDDSVSTKEGISLYSDFSSVIDAYGEEYTLTEGLYIYERGKSQIKFLVEDDEIVSIEYVAIVE
ncbi:MAG: hypothetical protein GX352_09605 [Clostridiales bacterium]|nr:hypothetical protein [Clostridiales bacterium]